MIRLIAYVLMTIGLVVSALAAASAYHTPLYLDDAVLQSTDADGNLAALTIKADAGVVAGTEEEIKSALADHFRLLGYLVIASPDPVTSAARQMELGLTAWSVEQIADKKPGRRSLLRRALAINRVATGQLLASKLDDVQGTDLKILLLRQGNPLPLARKRDKLTAPLLKELRLQAEIQDPRFGQRYVVVQEFSLERWESKWAFLGGTVLLLAGALLARAARKRATATVGTHREGPNPAAALSELESQLRNLLVEAKSMSEEEALRRIVERLGDLQRTCMQTFIDAREDLIARYGLASFADLMDHYAASDRQINRSWSAAADGYLEEALECLEEATHLVAETSERLKQIAGH